MAVIAKYAHGTPFLLPKYAGIVMINAAMDTASTAYKGTRRALTRLNNPQPGMPRSRENAYHVREALVRPAAPQNSWPTVQMISTIFAAHVLRPVSTSGIAPPPSLLIAATWVAANRSATSSAQPAIAE